MLTDEAQSIGATAVELVECKVESARFAAH
jgi:hypothetical protein